MRLSKRTEYGLRAIVHLARLWPTGFVQARDLAHQEKLPSKFLEAILLALRRGGFLESKVGSGGGYRLSRPPQQVLIGDVIRRLEGRLSSPSHAPASDASPGEVAIRVVNERLSAATDQALNELTLAELLEQVSRHSDRHAMYYI